MPGRLAPFPACRSRASSCSDAPRFDLLDETLYQQLLADPAPFAAELRTLAPKNAHGSPIPEERGALLEGFIHTLLLTYMAERDLAQEIAYWSPAGSRQTEVDFLLSRDAEHCALEIKASSRVQSQHLAGLRAIAPLPGLRRRVLVHQGERPGRTEDGIELWPIATLLDALQADSLWPTRTVSAAR